MRDRSLLAAVVALLGLLTGLLTGVQQLLPILTRRGDRSLGILIPAIGLVMFAVTTIAVFAAGYWAGTRTDVEREYLEIALLFGLVGGAATLVGSLLVPFLGAGEAINDTPAIVFGSAAYTGFVQVFNFAITGIAGAAVATFRQE